MTNPLNINTLRAEDIERQYKTVESKLLKLKADSDSKVASNGTTTTLIEPILDQRVISETEKLIIEKSLEEEDVRKYLLKDDNGNETGINKINYTAVLPGSKILSPGKAGTVDFINILKFTIKRFGTRDIYIISKGQMERRENRLCRYLINMVQYPTIRASIKASQGVFKKEPAGIVSYDKALDISQIALNAYTVKEVAETIYNNGVDKLNQAEIKAVTDKLTRFFANIPFPA